MGKFKKAKLKIALLGVMTSIMLVLSLLLFPLETGLSLPEGEYNSVSVSNDSAASEILGASGSSVYNSTAKFYFNDNTTPENRVTSYFVNGLPSASEAINYDITASTGKVDVSNDTSNTRGVTWSEAEQCAVFDGEAYYRLINNPIKGADYSTGFTISVDAYISSDNNSSGTYINTLGKTDNKLGWQRIFEITDGATSGIQFIYNAGDCNHLLVYFSPNRGKGTSADPMKELYITQNGSYYNAWHNLTMTVHPNGTCCLYVDGIMISSGNNSNTALGRTVDLLGSQPNSYIGSDTWEDVSHTSPDGFFFGKMRNMQFITHGNFYSLAFNSNGGTAYGNIVTDAIPSNLPVPVKTGYNFAGWYTDSSLTTAAAEATALSTDTTLYAKWTIKTGDGTPENPYEITTPQELATFRDIVNGINGQTKNDSACAIIMADLDMSSICNASNSWVCMGYNNDGYTVNQFKGTLDGNGHTISNIYLTADERYRGLVGILGATGVVKDLTITDSTYTCPGGFTGHFGSFVGVNFGLIENCTVKDSAISSQQICTGGIVGTCQDGGKVIECKNINTSVSGITNVGGICGYAIPNSSGLNNVIENCLNTGKVLATTDSDAGGILGYGGSIVMKNCYNAGSVNGPSNVGGLMGNYNSGSVDNSYYLENCATINTSNVVNQAVGNNTSVINNSLALTSAERFASGEICHALSVNNEGVWFQNIEEDAFPVLNDNSHKSVYLLTYLDETDEFMASFYLNEIDESAIIDPPAEPEGIGYYFNWYVSSSRLEGQEFYPESDAITGDLTLYALWQQPELEEYNYSAIDISNKADVLEISPHKIYPEFPTLEANRSTLKVHLTNIGDEVTIYKVADIPYDSRIKLFGNPVWVDEVQNYIAEKGLNYPSPASLAKAYASEQKVFYTNLLIGDEDNVTTGETPLLPYQPVGQELSTFKYEAPAEGEDLPSDLVLTISGMEIGEYVVVAENGSRKFTPFVVNIVPQRTGTNGEYFIMDLYEISLKAAEANVTKYIVKGAYDSATPEEPLDINDVHVDTAAIDDIKSFRLVVDMPTYKDRITLSSVPGNNVNSYHMTLTDYMDESMTLVGAASDIELYYKSGSGIFTVLPSSTVVTCIAFAENGYPGSVPLTAESGIETELTDCSYVKMTNQSLFTVTLLGSRESENNANSTESGFAISFNIAALKAFAKENGMSSIPQLEVRYKCLVTDKIRVGSELNINTATIEYEISDDGNEITTQSDVVNLYSYGLNLHKLDGDTKKALSGASFYLYKRNDDLTDIELYKNDSDYYLYTYDDEETGDEITAVFEKVTTVGDNGSIVTTVDENGLNPEGNNFDGLSEGFYILEEYAAPVGYNRLGDDMLFEITRFSDEEAVAANNGSLAAIKDEEGNAVESGYFSVTVLNYKGITLPATGGNGTILFTLIGLATMSVALGIFVSKKRQYADVKYC